MVQDERQTATSVTGLRGEIRILITGGGTGGHVAPALAVVQTLREMAQGQAWSPVFQYIGSREGIEKKLAGEANIPFQSVACGKLRRAHSLRGLFTWENLADAFRVPQGIAQALGLVRTFRPDVVFSTGGYVSVPAIVAASLLSIPVLTHEQTAQVGLANQIAARFATRIALSFEGALADLPPGRRDHAFVTGNPVRQIIFGGDKDRAIAHFGFSHEDDLLPTVYVTGGAQGAHVLNEAVLSALPELLPECRLIHQCGVQKGSAVQDETRLLDAVARLSPELARRYAVRPFIGEEIGDVFALTDILVGRSGAGTVTEAAALGLPAIYVPLVPTGGDEHTKNARRFAEIGAALLIKNAELDGPRLLSELRLLLSDPARRVQMSAAARTLARPEAARDLARAVLELVRIRA